MEKRRKNKHRNEGGKKLMVPKKVMKNVTIYRTLFQEISNINLELQEWIFTHKGNFP